MNSEKAARIRECDREALGWMLVRHGPAEVLRMLAGEVLEIRPHGYPEAARLAGCLEALAEGTVAR